MTTKANTQPLGQLYTIAFTALLGVFAAPGQADAACPATYATDSCDAQSGMEICERVGDTFRCKMDTGTGNGGATAWMIWDSVNSEYSAYGTAGNGNTFCCNLANVTGLEEVHLVGSDAADSLLSFEDATNGLELDAYSTSLLRALILAGQGDDELHGSNSTNPAYEEVLHGEDGYDIILGQGGDDIILGGKNGDYVEGGSGNDHINGESGHDTLLGGDGDDIIVGGDGRDEVNGDGGTDHIIGESGGDTLCGGGYTGMPDAFDGGDGPDYICGVAGGLETGTGGFRSDVCYDTTTLVDSCSPTMTAGDCLAMCP